MQDALDKQESAGLISQVTEGEWLSSLILAPKPHQENVFDIENLVWRLHQLHPVESSHEGACLLSSSL
jgi:hypothetical protein